MERLTWKSVIDEHEDVGLNDGDSVGDAICKLAEYEETGLGPEEITTEPYGCVFYCNRKCNLDGYFCTEGPGCPWEINAETAKHLLELAQAEEDGRLPHPSYTTGRIAGFGEGGIHILDKVLTREEAEAALKKMEEEDNEAD